MRSVTSAPADQTDLVERTDQSLTQPGDWVCLVWDDPVNTMNYVTYVFSSHFGYPRPRAEQLMLRVHQTGRAVVASGSRERMESDVSAMHAFGLWATLEPAT
ncbi:MAG: ATP-dependent Clp protease adapter ClpS [Propionibacteriaceae bacterium]|jgi:ATP-dependent Clp protease adaptor protein ClpS|nr:ATP-dependent Clp protease adapter ClpS [Propionibacteriaceae bacterium]